MCLFCFLPFFGSFCTCLYQNSCANNAKETEFFFLLEVVHKGFIGVNCTTPNQKKIASPLHSRRDYQLIHKCKKSKIGEKQNKNNQTRRRNELFASITLVKVLLRVQIEIKLVLNYITFNRRVVLSEATTCFSCLELFQVNFSKLRLRFLFMLVYFFVIVCFLSHRNIPVQIKVIN